MNTGFGFGGHFFCPGQGSPRLMTLDSRESHGDFDLFGENLFDGGAECPAKRADTDADNDDNDNNDNDCDDGVDADDDDDNDDDDDDSNLTVEPVLSSR